MIEFNVKSIVIEIVTKRIIITTIITMMIILVSIRFRTSAVSNNIYIYI